MSTVAPPMQQQSRGRAFSALVLGTRQAELSVDVVLLVVRIVLAWIFIYYGAGKLFGWFNGPGMHQTSLFMADTAYYYPEDRSISESTTVGRKLARVALSAA